jgi:EAL and modified HD-GYP domain-containing signal transduction protein
MLDGAFISRLPITDSKKEVCAFELAILSAEGEGAPSSSSAAQVYLEMLTNVGFSRMVGGHPAHVDVDEAFILGQVLPAPTHPLVLELQRDVRPDPHVVEALKGWRDAGFVLAIDDLQPDDERLPLLESIKLVKVNVEALDEIALATVCAQARTAGCAILAYGIVDAEQMHRGATQGATLYQGEWTATIEPSPKLSMAAQRGKLLHLLTRLYDPKVTATEIEKLVSQDPVLSLRLLQVANSTLYRRTKPVESVRATIAILGLNQISTWVSLIVMSTVDGSPSQSLVNTMTRAKLCELLARELRMESDRMFTVGLLSSFERALGLPMKDLIGNMALSKDVIDALMTRKGKMGEVLRMVEAHEQRQWDALQSCGLTTEQINEAWVGAIGWADAACRSTSAVSTPAPASRR